LTAWLARWLYTTNHKDVGVLYLFTSLYFFVAAGVLALTFRYQLAVRARAATQQAVCKADFDTSQLGESGLHAQHFIEAGDPFNQRSTVTGFDEFSGQSYEAILSTLQRGRLGLESRLGQTPRGYIPPNNQANRATGRHCDH